MSVERPESVSRPVTLLARATSLAMVAVGVGIALAAPWAAFGATMSIAAGTTGWLMANKTEKVRDYNESRLKAIKTAERKGEAPHLPKNPFLDPKKQPSPFLTKMSRYLAGAMIVAGMLAPLALFGDATSFITNAEHLSFLPEMVKQAGAIGISAIGLLGGASLLKMASVAESTRRFAEHEVAHHARYKDDLELTHAQEFGVATLDAPSHDYDTASHPANQPDRKSFVASLFEERGLERGAGQERL